MKKEILYSIFNYNYNYLLIGTKEGCTVYQISSNFKKGFELGIKGQFSLVQMLRESNIFAIVGSNKNKEIKKSNVIIWDDSIKKKIYEFNTKEKSVLNIKLAFEKLIIVCTKVIYIINLSNLESFQLIDIIETGFNELGLVAVNNNQNNKKFQNIKKEEETMEIFKENKDDDTIIVYPSKSEGTLTIKNYENTNYIYLKPHKSGVVCFNLSDDGKYLVTGGKSGKKIRIFKTENGKLLDELDRKEDSIIKFIFIDPSNLYVGASSNNGIIKLWSLDKAKEKEDKQEITFESEININKNEKLFDYNEIELKDKNEIYRNIQFKNGNSNCLFIITLNKAYDVECKKEKKNNKIKELFTI